MNPQTPVRPWLVRLRLPVLFLSFAAIAYFTIMVALAPRYEIAFQTSATGEMEITSVAPGTSAERYFQPGDWIIAVNGWPLKQAVDWHLLYPIQDTQIFTLRRGTQILTSQFTSDPLTLVNVKDQLTPHVVAFLDWVLGAVVLLFATPKNRPAWRVGFVFLNSGVALAALSAAIVQIPGSATAAGILLPVTAAGFVELALLPRIEPPSRRTQRILTVIYASALLIVIIQLIDIYVFRPTGQRLYDRIGLSPNILSYLYAALFLVINAILVAVRYLRTPQSYLKQQLRIIIIGMLFGYGPLIFLTILPGALTQNFDALIPHNLTLLLIVLWPASYAYVIYRHRYLGLDLWITETLALLVMSLLFLIFYSLFFTTLRKTNLESLEPLPSSIFLVAAILLVPQTSKTSQRVTQRLLYGDQVHYQKILSRMVDTLATNPDLEVLKQVVRDLSDQLQVRQAALFLVDAISSDYIPVEQVRTMVHPILATEANLVVPPEMVVRSSLEEDELQPHVLLAQYDWTEVIVPISIGELPVGLLLLGQRTPDGSFDAHRLAFVREVCATIGITAHSLRLFESLLAMSRQLIQVQDAERRNLAGLLHDDPLQQISVVLPHLDRLAQQAGSTSPDKLKPGLLQIKNILSGVNRQIRDICAGLLPPVLSQGNMEWAIRDAERKFKDIQPDVSVDIQLQVPEDSAISEEKLTAIYYVLREALSNIHKHAQASQVRIALAQEAGQVRLLVEDNGVGPKFHDPSLADLVRRRHFGIVSMHERAKMVGGLLQIRQRTSGGTVVTFSC